MTPYLIAYAILILCLIVGLAVDRLRLAAIIAFLPMFYLIAARGLVGVDSAFYLQLFETIRYVGTSGAYFEPGFSLIVALLTRYLPDSFDILILLGCVTAVTMLVAALLLERQPILFLAIVMPFFLFDMTMNGLRYGLAFAIVAIGAAGLIRGRLWLFLACAILAASIQVSSVVVAAGAWALLEARLKTFLLISISAIGFAVIFGDYLGEKAAINTELAAPGGTAGIIPYFITLVTLLAVTTDKEVFQQIKFPVFAIAGLQTVVFVMSRYYYAGLRMQAVILFLMYIMLAVNFARMKFMINSKPAAVMLLIGVALMSSVLRLRNIWDEQGVGQSPFAPYYFASEVAF